MTGSFRESKKHSRGKKTELKARTSKIIKIVILTLLTVYATGTAVWAHMEASKHVCTGITIEVDGTAAMDSVVRHGVREELRRYPRQLVGTPLHSLNTGDVERYLSRSNNFESVNCMISSRGQLVIKIAPLVPVMRVFYGDNSYYINKAGKHIVSNAEFFSDVPAVTGRFSRNFTPSDILPLVNYISNDPVLSDYVSMIDARNRHNLILVPRIRGHVINFGDTTRLDEKKRMLMLFYRKVTPYKGWAEYDTISVKYRGQIVATRRDKSKLNHAEEYEEETDLEEGTLPRLNDNEPEREDTPREKSDTTKKGNSPEKQEV